MVFRFVSMVQHENHSQFLGGSLLWVCLFRSVFDRLLSTSSWAGLEDRLVGIQHFLDQVCGCGYSRRFEMVVIDIFSGLVRVRKWLPRCDGYAIVNNVSCLVPPLQFYNDIPRRIPVLIELCQLVYRFLTHIIDLVCRHLYELVSILPA